MDACAKILTLPRSDSAICFAGTTHAAYPLLLQIAYAIAAHAPARDRAMDVGQLQEHLLRLCNDLINRFKEAAAPFQDREVQFLFGGYSWLTQDFRIWTFDYRSRDAKFVVRESRTFHEKLRKAAFIGDQSRRLREELFRTLRPLSRAAHMEPLGVLSELLRSATPTGTIGGAPQVIQITQHMNTRPLVVRWNNEDTLFGRPLFQYERVDYWSIDPFSGLPYPPDKFGEAYWSTARHPGVALVKASDP